MNLIRFFQFVSKNFSGWVWNFSGWSEIEKWNSKLKIKIETGSKSLQKRKSFWNPFISLMICLVWESLFLNLIRFFWMSLKFFLRWSDWVLKNEIENRIRNWKLKIETRSEKIKMFLKVPSETTGNDQMKDWNLQRSQECLFYQVSNYFWTSNNFQSYSERTQTISLNSDWKHPPNTSRQNYWWDWTETQQNELNLKFRDWWWFQDPFRRFSGWFWTIELKNRILPALKSDFWNDLIFSGLILKDLKSFLWTSWNFQIDLQRFLRWSWKDLKRFWKWKNVEVWN